jgi:hypothetical protein
MVLISEAWPVHHRRGASVTPTREHNHVVEYHDGGPNESANHPQISGVPRLHHHSSKWKVLKISAAEVSSSCLGNKCFCLEDKKATTNAKSEVERD